MTADIKENAEGEQTAVYSVSRAEWEGLDAPLIGGNECHGTKAGYRGEKRAAHSRPLKL